MRKYKAGEIVRHKRNRCLYILPYDIGTGDTRLEYYLIVLFSGTFCGKFYGGEWVKNSFDKIGILSEFEKMLYNMKEEKL